MIMGFLFIFCLLNLYSRSVVIEKYVPEVVLELKWGEVKDIDEKPYNVGYGGDIDDPYRYMPDITVDSKGYIYLLDVINNKIQKYNRKGRHEKSIEVDSFKNVSGVEIRGVSIVTDLEDILYYYCIKEKRGRGEKRGEIWIFKDDRLVKKKKIPINKLSKGAIMYRGRDGKIWVGNEFWGPSYNVPDNKFFSENEYKEYMSKILDKQECKLKLERSKEGIYLIELPNGKEIEIEMELPVKLELDKGIMVDKDNLISIWGENKEGKSVYYFDLKGQLVKILKGGYPWKVYNSNHWDQRGNYYVLDINERGINVKRFVRKKIK